MSAFNNKQKHSSTYQLNNSWCRLWESIRIPWANRSVASAMNWERTIRNSADDTNCLKQTNGEEATTKTVHFHCESRQLIKEPNANCQTSIIAPVSGFFVRRILCFFNGAWEPFWTLLHLWWAPFTQRFAGHLILFPLIIITNLHFANSSTLFVENMCCDQHHRFFGLRFSFKKLRHSGGIFSTFEVDNICVLSGHRCFGAFYLSKHHWWNRMGQLIESLIFKDAGLFALERSVDRSFGCLIRKINLILTLKVHVRLKAKNDCPWINSNRRAPLTRN